VRNIRRLVAHEDLCVRLAQAAHPASGRPLFGTYRDLACFAAMLGFEQGRKPDLTDQPLELFVDSRIFERSETAVDVAYLIALADAKRVEALADTLEAEEEAISNFERYAAGGLAILQEWLDAEPSDPDGEKAVLTALAKGGYLATPENLDDALRNVVF